MSMLDPRLEPPHQVRRLEVITGTAGRRRWSAAAKARIVEETMAPGAVVSEVARRHGLRPQQLFTWRRLARQTLSRAQALFVPALVEATPDPPPCAASQPRGACRPEPVSGIELEMDGILVRVGPAAGEGAIAAVIRALRAAS
jgi:transposase